MNKLFLVARALRGPTMRPGQTFSGKRHWEQPYGGCRVGGAPVLCVSVFYSRSWTMKLRQLGWSGWNGRVLLLWDRKAQISSLTSLQAMLSRGIALKRTELSWTYLYRTVCDLTELIWHGLNGTELNWIEWNYWSQWNRIYWNELKWMELTEI